MMRYLCWSLFALAASATPLVANKRENTIAITSLEKHVNATSGSGNVAAAGRLSPFGDIGTGCGINWQEDVSYGGGLQAGSKDFGLGSGFTISPENITIGAGIGLNTANASASIQFTGSRNGSVELLFESTAPIACVPGMRDGKTIVRCRTM